MNQYKQLRKIGQGSFGEVYHGCTVEGHPRALKTVRISGGTSLSGFPNTALREIRALRELDHTNVVRLYDVTANGSSVVLVMEYMVCDLATLLSGANRPFSETRVKRYSAMLFDGLAYIHNRQIIHRDLKPSNLLLSASGTLKIADFGLARVHDNQNMNMKSYTHQVATRWYRAPELLFGARYYGIGVDLWAAGAIVAEMLNHSPLFPGENDINQIYRVIQVLGQPQESEWPEVASLPDYGKIRFPDLLPLPFEHLFPGASDMAIDLVRRLLKYNPRHRLVASAGRQHVWFFKSPREEGFGDNLFLEPHRISSTLTKSRAHVQIVKPGLFTVSHP